MTRILAKRHFLALGLLVSGLVTFAACGAAGVNAPLSVSDILTKAQHANPTDASFTLTFAITGTSSGTAVNTQLNGTGELTKSPQRSHEIINGTISGITITVEDVTDGTTDYTKTTSPSLPSDGKWQKSTVSSSSPAAVPTFATLYTQIKNPKLIGTEKVNGNDTYHITGTPIEDTPTAGTPATTTTTAAEDIWVRTDNFYPAKFSITGSSASGTGLVDTGTSTIVILFTKWDSGITIAVPSPDQVSASS